MLEDLQKKASDFMHSGKGKEAIDKAKEFVSSEEGKKKISDAKEKLEDFVEDKTNGKGIFGFGKK
ncbi:MAG: hypothetical protein NC217_05435 [Muribaculaceae bacterium]|nr:hypothetical protein [Muribaculaceae bacterium]